MARSLESTRGRGLAVALRLPLGAWLIWCVGLAVVAPELTWLAALTAAWIFATTLWRPSWGLVAVAVAAPAGALFALAPARAAELFTSALLAGWLLRVWRPLSAEPWPRAITVPAVLYGGALAASWLSLTMSGAAGVPWTALPRFLLESIPRDHLVFSAPEAETWTLLQSAAGLGLFAAAVGITREDPRSVRPLAAALGGSLAALAAATLADIARQWGDVGYGAWFLMRYVRLGERFSLHMADLNAAGSLYAMAGLIAAAHVIAQEKQRGRWAALLGVLLPAMWLAGSRSAYLGVVGGLALLAAVHRGWQPRRGLVVAGASLALVAGIVMALVVAQRSDVQGSIGASANLRSQFLLTSVRMFASSPVFGVGIGRYFDRSAEYMTPELREIYGNENAHNYFAQQFSELGLAGGLTFLWLVGAALWAGWSRLRHSPTDAALLALFAGTGGYLLTCVTGHPLLVPEAALPFWAALGTVAGTCGHTSARSHSRVLAAVMGLVLAVGVGTAAVSYGRLVEPPAESGFHGLETAADGTEFRWMTRHAVTYIPDGPGFLRLRLRAPDRPMPRPLVVETSIAGRVVDRREVTSGSWVSFDVPARQTDTPFRRVDFRVNQLWTEEVRLGQRTARRPIAVMTGPIDWMPLQ